MKEKGFNYWKPSSPLLQWRFGLLSATVLLGMVAVWSVDSSTMKSFLEAWKPRQDFSTTTQVSPSSIRGGLPLKPSSPVENQTLFTTDIISETQLAKTPISSESGNETRLASWVGADLEANVTINLLSRWLAPGGEPCKDSKTVEISMPTFDGLEGLIELQAGEIHELVFQAVDEGKNPRCLGGDYFETDLSGDSWKSRPLVSDFGNGTYSVKLQVHPDFVGTYNFTVTLLFRHFEGLRFSPSRFVFDKELRRFQIRFVGGLAQLPDIGVCRESDFDRDLWAGRWTRHARNDQCEISDDGRFRCLDANLPCRGPWCEGALGLLESNGWVYSAHCSFRIFSEESAWECLNGKWLFFWGDSNHVDSIRNLLNFVLGRPEIPAVPRRFDRNFTNPRDPSQSVRITNIFNGHWNETQNYQGLNSLKNAGFRDLVRGYFAGATVPDAVVINSGLHDGVFWSTIRAFTKGAKEAAAFWAEIMDEIRARGSKPPRVLFRSTIATGGYARALAFNPEKMEAFNWVFLDSLRRAGVVSGVVDNFDMTFPWHYDNRCNDGVHYGRIPAKMKWRDGQIGHQYFVDLMLGHVLLNALCPKAD